MPPRRSRWLLGSRDYTFLTAARLLAGFANQMQAVATGWLMYDLTRDPLYLGLVGLAEAVPALGLALHAGWIVDRGRPAAIVRRAYGASALSALVLWMVSGPAADHAAARTRIAAIFGAAMLAGVARAFAGPAQFSLLPAVVPRRTLGRAAAMNVSLFQSAALAGPPLGGALLAVGGNALPFQAVAVLLAGAFAAIGRVGPGWTARPQADGGPGAAADVLSGARYVFANQVILAALALDMFAVLFGGAVALFPVFARDLFANGPVGLGLLRAAMPVGKVAMGAVMLRHPVTGWPARVLLWVVAGFGLATIGFGLSTSFPLSLFLLAVAGACDAVSMVMRHTILQLSVPEGLKGRVSAVNSMFIGSSNEIGAFESGVAAKLLGTRASVFFGGLMTLVVVAVTWALAPRLRGLKLSRL